MDLGGIDYFAQFIKFFISMIPRKGIFHSVYNIYDDYSLLNQHDKELLASARTIALKAYAPYSGFNVGAVALMENNTIITGTNQENASFPIGLCAERVLLAAISSVAPDLSIKVLAISYSTEIADSAFPIAPCGICRQSLVEFEARYKSPIRLLLSGSKGEVYEFDSVSSLLPLSFKAENLGK